MNRARSSVDRRFDFFGSMMSTWLSEVRAEVSEAKGILSDSDGSNRWWAERILRRLTENSPPEVHSVSGEDQASTLIEIAFWSGWLKGELETLERCDQAITAVGTGGTSQLSLPVTFADGASGAARHSPAECERSRSAAEGIIGRIDAMNYMPGAELVSISLSSALDSCMGKGAAEVEGACIRALEELSETGSTSALVALAFSSGMLAGFSLKDGEGSR